MNEKSQIFGGIRFFGRYPAYVRYFISTIITRFGDSLDAIAYMWLVLDLTGSTLAMATVMVINSVPNILLGPFAGVIADRADRKRLIVACDFIRGLGVAIIAALTFMGRLELWMLFATTLLGSVAETVQGPARMAITPSLVAGEDLITGNAMNSTGESLAQFIGLGAAEAIIGAVGTAGAIAIDALTFWISASLIATLPIASGAGKLRDLSVKAFLNDLVDGLRFVGRTRIVLLCIILAGLTNFFLGPGNVLLPAFMKMELKLTAGSLSLVYLVETAAMLLGSIITPGLARKISELLTMRMGFFLIALGYALLAFARNAPSVAACLFILGIGVPFASAGFRTFVQRDTPMEKLGRVGAVMSTLVLAAMPVSTAAAGALGEKVRPQHLFGALGMMVFLSTVLLTFNRAFRTPKPAAGESGQSGDSEAAIVHAPPSSGT